MSSRQGLGVSKIRQPSRCFAFALAHQWILTCRQGLVGLTPVLQAWKPPAFWQTASQPQVRFDIRWTVARLRFLPGQTLVLFRRHRERSNDCPSNLRRQAAAYTAARRREETKWEERDKREIVASDVTVIHNSRMAIIKKMNSAVGEMKRLHSIKTKCFSFA